MQPGGPSERTQTTHQQPTIGASFMKEILRRTRSFLAGEEVHVERLLRLAS